VIIHGVKESDCDQPKDREDEDLGIIAAMLHEMSCDDVKVTKVRSTLKPQEFHPDARFSEQV